MNNKLKLQGLLRDMISEESINGLKVTTKAQKESKKFNDEYEKDVAKKMSDYEEPVMPKEDKDIDKYNKPGNVKDDADIENTDVRNGMELLNIEGEPNEAWEKRQDMALKGDSKMGNETKTGEWNPETGEGNGNTEEVWGASGGKVIGDDIAKNVKNIKAMRKKDKVGKEADKVNMHENVGNFDNVNPLYKEFFIKRFGRQPEHDPSYFETWVERLNSGDTTQMDNESLSVWKSLQNGGMNGGLNENKNKTKNTMKRLRFKKPFDGVGNALNLIPESYKVDSKEFEMTDGNENYRIRWEGDLNEGNAVVLTAADQTMINEDMTHMKHLMGFKSEETLGRLKGSDRINENETFKDVWKLTQGLMNENATGVAGMGFVSEELEEDVDITEDDVNPKVKHANAEGPMVMKEEDDDDEETAAEKRAKEEEDALADGAPASDEIYEGAFDFLKKKSEPKEQGPRVLGFEEWWKGTYGGQLTVNDKVEFEGQQFSLATDSGEIKDDDYQSTGTVPRIENGVLITPNRNWQN